MSLNIQDGVVCLMSQTDFRPCTLDVSRSPIDMAREYEHCNAVIVGDINGAACARMLLYNAERTGKRIIERQTKIEGIKA